MDLILVNTVELSQTAGNMEKFHKYEAMCVSID